MNKLVSEKIQNLDAIKGILNYYSDYSSTINIPGSETKHENIFPEIEKYILTEVSGLNYKIIYKINDDNKCIDLYLTPIVVSA